MKGSLYEIYKAERNEHNHLALRRSNRDIACDRNNKLKNHANATDSHLSNQDVRRSQRRLLYTNLVSIAVILVSIGLLVSFVAGA